ncbi:hypothetical protein ABLT80_15670 [Acinetobacter schindleri]|uniref:hypothetical protein n=1 Tax=Acinetobacter schindleri TaxID=108981 RepID=UPI0032B39820
MNLTFQQKVEIPVVTTDKADHYFFSSHFSWIYAYFYENKQTDFKFRAYKRNNSYEFIIQALTEVKSLLCSGLHNSITGLDIIANWLNEQYSPTHLHDVFGHKILTINHLRQLSGLSKSRSPTSTISSYTGPLLLETILVSTAF